MKAFLIDLNKCVGCYDCQIACKDEHCGNDWSPYAKPQPDTGQFWLRLNETEHGARPHVKVSYVPVMCQHCDNAACMEACDQAPSSSAKTAWCCCFPRSATAAASAPKLARSMPSS